ncbi:hypothetical protein [Amycolatopsis sp. H20-H5]|uniref:hypothetical protein n=1 Tax=Amycolatopsis sp. H20-H5 TaxID=3046309 RepID=UPI002DB78A48|nr:hypothetical protein [Amycolatopsis sp. H20-H5]MEC3974954.1 hypothetical protein [Amycolatopsis sp. H20-H5]
MDVRDFAIFYPRLAAELRQIEIGAMPGWVKTPRGLRPARRVLPEVTFATAVYTALTVWLVVGLTRWDWAAWWWIPAAVSGLITLHGVGRTVLCARTLVTYWRGGDR